jgi:hypothetical protein
VYKFIIALFSALAVLTISYALLCNFSNAKEIHVPLTSTLSDEYWLEWDSLEGRQRQDNSQHKTNLYKLLRFYEAQTRKSYCGIAAAVIALNSLGIQTAKSQHLENSYFFTQESFFDGKVGEAIDPILINKRGLTLSEMALIMDTQPLAATVYEAASLTDAEIRNKIVSALINPSQIVIALYHRKELNQEGKGHWSPVAAYDQNSDSFLVLDVARYRYPPAWINAKAFIAGMKALNSTGHSRGFVILDNSSK